MPNATCKKNNSKNIDSLCDKQLKYFFSFKIVENQQHAPEVLFSGGTGGEEYMPGYFGCGDIGGAAGAGGDGGGGGCGGCGGCGC